MKLCHTRTTEVAVKHHRQMVFVLSSLVGEGVQMQKLQLRQKCGGKGLDKQNLWLSRGGRADLTNYVAGVFEERWRWKSEVEAAMKVGLLGLGVVSMVSSTLSWFTSGILNNVEAEMRVVFRKALMESAARWLILHQLEGGGCEKWCSVSGKCGRWTFWLPRILLDRERAMDGIFSVITTVRFSALDVAGIARNRVLLGVSVLSAQIVCWSRWERAVPRTVLGESGATIREGEMKQGEKDGKGSVKNTSSCVVLLLGKRME